jgi:hypothetical protein
MRMIIMHAVRGAARWIGRILAVRLPMDTLNGLRTR